ncbi:hypothetical protein [Curtobacterium flaccumfaciens]|uniref:hypothetical protein n=1 Tax=Curtobacterium flaccumfaciens TaxID=2035 RepID=UPI0039939041
MILLTTDWHAAWTTYEWWRDIGASVISAGVAVVIGASTVTVAVTSARFARAVKRQEDERNRRLDEGLYEARLLEVVGDAMVQALEYINLFAGRWSWGDVHHRRAQGAVTARITLADAVARGRDRDVTTAILGAFIDVSETPNKTVQVEGAGELVGLLAALASRKYDPAEVLEQTQTVLDRARQGAAI